MDNLHTTPNTNTHHAHVQDLFLMQEHEICYFIVQHPCRRIDLFDNFALSHCGDLLLFWLLFAFDADEYEQDKKMREVGIILGGGEEQSVGVGIAAESVHTAPNSPRGETLPVATSGRDYIR